MTNESFKKRPTLVLPEKQFLQVALGENHLLALLEDRQSIYCWGINNFACLSASFDPKSVRTEENPFFFQLKKKYVELIDANSNNSAFLSNGKIHFWGLKKKKKNL